MNISSTAAVSGIQASILRHDITAHDVANINTPGFSQSTPYQVEKSPSGTEVSAIIKTPNNDPALSNTDFANEAVEMKTNKTKISANSAVIKVQDRMVGELIDLFA